MQKLGAWFTGMAAAGLLMSLLQTLIPEKGRKTFQLASGLIMILLILSPVRTSGAFSASKLLEDFERQISANISEFSSRSASAAEEMAIRETEEFLRECLEADGIFVSITLKTTEADSGSRIFHSAIVRPQSELTPAEQETIERLIEEQTGIPAERQSMR